MPLDPAYPTDRLNYWRRMRRRAFWLVRPQVNQVNTEPEPSDLVRPRVLATDIASVTVAPECADLGLD